LARGRPDINTEFDAALAMEPHMRSNPLHHARLIFIGGGNMARSLIGGLLQRGHQASAIHVVEPNAPLREALQNDFGVTCHADNSNIRTDADCVLLAVKPQVMRAVCEGLRDKIGNAVLLSVAAGITTTQIADWTGSSIVVRCMPNTPALIGVGASGLFAAASVSEAQRALASHLLEAVGIARWIDDEAQMDIVTALSGSGPAYVFYLVEAMSAAATPTRPRAPTPHATSPSRPALVPPACSANPTNPPTHCAAASPHPAAPPKPPSNPCKPTTSRKSSPPPSTPPPNAARHSRQRRADRDRAQR
jgi:pyrroline-5-carboxylate reductase